MEPQDLISPIFDSFLEKKNIDAKAFQEAYPQRYEEWKSLFEQVHEDSFVMQKKFYINPIRRKFPLNRF